MTMSISWAPASTAARTSSSLMSRGDRPEGNAVATAATFTSDPASASTAVSTRSPYTQMAATGGQDGSVGSGRRPLAHRARTLPGVS